MDEGSSLYAAELAITHNSEGVHIPSKFGAQKKREHFD